MPSKTWAACQQSPSPPGDPRADRDPERRRTAHRRLGEPTVIGGRGHLVPGTVAFDLALSRVHDPTTRIHHCLGKSANVVREFPDSPDCPAPGSSGPGPIGSPGSRNSRGWPVDSRTEAERGLVEFAGHGHGFRSRSIPAGLDPDPPGPPPGSIQPVFLSPEATPLMLSRTPVRVSSRGPSPARSRFRRTSWMKLRGST